MCLTVTNPGIQIAKKDIKCYKYLQLKANCLTRLVSQCQGFPYSLNKLYSKKSFPERVYKEESLGDQGYHSFRHIKYVSYYIITELHRNKYCHNNVAVLCVIPKGSKYILGAQSGYENEKQYLSEKIILKEIITEKVAKRLKNNEYKRKQKNRVPIK